MTEETLFAAALDRADPAERSEFLAAHCPDPAARRRVEELLAAHAAAGSFLDHPVVGADVTTDLPPSSDPGVTRTQAPTDPDATAAPHAGPADPDEALAFLRPPTRPGSLGRLAHYEVLEVIGSGGFGTVLKAFDDRLHRVVAVKVLAPQLAASGAARARFLREARTAAAVRDEHVVNVFAVSDDEAAVPFLVMELVAGQTLQGKIDKAGPLPPKEVLRIGSQIARGLAAAHRQGLIHRDIKPANILLENGVERVKVTDFGLARAADDASISQSGVVAGTPMYMSPEQARGDTLDTRSDLFSLGSVLYVLCTGRPPFRADTTLAVLKRVVEDDPRPVRDVNPEVPRWLADVVAKLHAKTPADRFQTAQEVADLLSGYLAELQQQGTVVSRVAAPPQPRRPSRRWAWAAGCLLLLVGLPVGLTALGLGLPAIQRAMNPDPGEVVVMPSPGLESVRPYRAGQPAAGWVDVSNGRTLRLPPGRYTLESRVSPGVTAAAWEVTGTQPALFGAIGHNGRQPGPVAEFELVAGGRVTVRAETAKVRPPGAASPTPAVAPFTPEQAKEHQEAWAKHLGVPVEFEGKDGLTFRLIPPGEFGMGFTADELAAVRSSLQRLPNVGDYQRFAAESSGPRHTVRITRPFYLAKYETTAGQFRRFVEAAKHTPTGGIDWQSFVTPGQEDRQPVIGVSWDDATAFCRRLGPGYELPTEAQWEYAARGGAPGLWSFGNNPEKLLDHAVVGQAWPKPGPVGVKAPNPFGLFDIHGGADEWCRDWHVRDFYRQSPIDDPVNLEAPADPNTGRASRGGSWNAAAVYSEVAFRAFDHPTRPNLPKGFRVALTGDLKAAVDAARQKAAPPPAAAPFTAAEAKAHQEAWAAHLGVKVEFENRVGMKMRLIPPGEFTAGTTDADKAQVLADLRAGPAPQFALDDVAAEPPPARVRVADPFYADAHEVTVGQFRRFVAATGYQTDGEKAKDGGWADRDGRWQRHPDHQWRTPGNWTPGDDEPVTQVSWNDARAFCAWLGMEDGRVYALPTGGQWEYAARAGSAGRHAAADGPAALDAAAWFAGNLPAARPGRPQPVGGKQANAFGLYDTLGNVWEWCADASPLRPGGRVTLGGGWNSGPASARVNTRGVAEQDRAWDAGTGFRVVVVGDLRAPDERAGFVPLFNGKDLTGWVPVYDGKASRAAPWDVVGDVLALKGEPAGYLRTEKEYRAFHLRYECRATPFAPQDVQRNSAVLWGVRGPDDAGKAPAAARLELVTGKDGRPVATVYSSKGVAPAVPPTNVVGPPAADGWNRVEVVSRADELEVRVNGAAKVIKGVGPLPGFLGLHGNKQGLHLRNVEVRELPPAPLAQARQERVAATEREVSAAKARFAAGRVTRREVAEAEAALIEARLDGAPGAAAVRLLGQLVKQHEVRRGVVASRVEGGIQAPTALDTIDADLAKAKARLAEAKLAAPPPAAAPFTADQAKAHQEAWARHLGVQPEVSNDLGMRFRVVPAGSFLMGSTAEEVALVLKASPDLRDAEAWEQDRVRSEAPARKATITEPFLLGTHEVMVGQFREFVKATGHKTHAETTGGGAVWDNAAKKWNPDPEAVWHNPKYAASETHPVTFLNAADARAFCAWLGQQDGRTYALPTEEQWEFACRAGTATRWWFGDDPAGMKGHGWTVETAFGKHRPVGQAAANPFGLFDLHGNATEMATSPQGEVVERGGQANETAWRARAAWRNPVAEDSRPHGRRGFRVAAVGDPRGGAAGKD